MTFLAVLGLGDLTMTSVSFPVVLKNISDQLFVSWLPFSALTVAAHPVVGGMLGAAHFPGEASGLARHEPGLRQVIIGTTRVWLAGCASRSPSRRSGAPSSQQTG